MSTFILSLLSTFRPEAEGRGRIYTPFCPGLFGPVTSDVPFAGPCVVGRSPGVVCRTPGLTLEHFHRVFLVRYPFTQSFMFEDCTTPQKTCPRCHSSRAPRATSHGAISSAHRLFRLGVTHLITGWAVRDPAENGVLLLHPPLSSSQLPALLAVHEEYRPGRLVRCLFLTPFPTSAFSCSDWNNTVVSLHNHLPSLPQRDRFLVSVILCRARSRFLNSFFDTVQPPSCSMALATMNSVEDDEHVTFVAFPFVLRTQSGLPYYSLLNILPSTWHCTVRAFAHCKGRPRRHLQHLDKCPHSPIHEFQRKAQGRRLKSCTDKRATGLKRISEKFRQHVITNCKCTCNLNWNVCQTNRNIQILQHFFV